MAHLIETITDQEIPVAIKQLKACHAEIVSAVRNAQMDQAQVNDGWGVMMKRLTVDLSECGELVGKAEEKFVEIINILATTERTIDALEFFSNVYPEGRVKECHPSTSDNETGNDIVIVDLGQNIVARCEVCDVASYKAGQNGKERKDLKSLGITSSVPLDGTKRFIATSPEVAEALLSDKRIWKNKPYRYCSYSAGETTMLEVLTLNDG